MPPRVPSVHADDSEHRVEIGRLATRCRVLGSQQAAEQVRSELDGALSTRLPRALARATEPVLDGLDGVVRVSHLHLRVELGDAVDGFADRLAERIAGMLRTALLSADAEVMTWPDHDEYLADYLASRLGVRPVPRWPFEDLAVLDHLPAERATAEVVVKHPRVMGRLARIAAGSGDAGAVVAGWPVTARAALTAALVLEGRPAATTAELALAVELVRPHEESSGRPITVERAAAAALALALRALGGGAAVPVPAVVVAALATIATRVEDTEPPLPSAGAAPAAAGRVLEALGTARELAGDLVTRATPVASRTAVSEEALSRRTEVAEHGAGPPRRSPYAGLALLMPSVLGLGALDWLDPTELAHVVWQTLLAPDRDEVSHDRAVAELFPVDPLRSDPSWEQPEPPGALVAGLCDEARGLCHAAPAGEGWSALLLADLACRLPGLQASSAAYLRRQFLLRAGSIDARADRITVRLDPVPLGVVLRMAGHGTPAQRLPHVGDRWLVLDLSEGE